MGFVNFRTKIQEQFASMIQDSIRLFAVEVDKDEMWNLYLDSFPEGTNNIYRERREHDCSCCRQFVKHIGNVVAIKNGVVSTIWDVNIGDTTYQPVADALSAYIKSKAVENVFFSKEQRAGTSHNFELLPNGESKKWEHFYAEIPAISVERRRSIGDVQGEFRATKPPFFKLLQVSTLDRSDALVPLSAK